MICVMFKLIDFRILILKANVPMKHMVGFIRYLDVHGAGDEQWSCIVEFNQFFFDFVRLTSQARES